MYGRTIMNGRCAYGSLWVVSMCRCGLEVLQTRMGQAYYNREGDGGDCKLKSTEPIDAVNSSPLARFEPTTSTTSPRTTPAGI